MLRKVRKNQGFTLVEIMIAVSIVVLLSVLSIHSLLRTRLNANEAAAIGNLRTLQITFTSYRIVNPIFPEDMSILASDTPPYIDNTLAQGSKHSYNFRIEDVDTNTFRLAAVPRSPGVTGNRSFFIDQGGEITDENGAGLGGSSASVGVGTKPQ